MAKTHTRVQHVKLQYPKHLLAPEDLLHFIETRVFTRAWADLGLDDEDDLMSLQLLIMANPKGAPVVPDTGGLRKLRFSPPKWGVGKRDGLRICYVYFEEYWIVLLVHLYDKHQQETLGDAEKKAMRSYIRRQRAALNRRRTI